MKSSHIQAVLFIIVLSLASSFALANVPNPGHSASSVGPGTNGTFSPGNFTFPENLNVTGTLNVSGSATVQTIVYTPQLCLNGDCKIAWPSSGSGLSNGNVTAGYIPYFTNTTNLNASPLYLNQTTNYLGIGTLSPLAAIDVSGSIRAGGMRADTYSTGGGSAMFIAQGSNLRTASGGAFTNSTFEYNGSVQFIMTNTGRLGVNTSAPLFALDVAGSANISNTLFTPQLCLNGDCKTAWPSGGSGLSANETATNNLTRFTNSTNVIPAAISDNGSAIIIGRQIISSGGNNRGSFATDLQLSRTFASQIASGDYSVITGGRSNNASGNYSNIIGGYDNTVGDSVSTIAGGYTNTINYTSTTSANIIGAGRLNVIQATESAIVGGIQNSINGGTTYASFIGAGRSNKIDSTTGYNSIVSGYQSNITGTGGYNFIGSSYRSAISGGDTNGIVAGQENFINSGAGSFIGSGYRAGVSGAYSFIGTATNSNISGGASYGFIGAGIDNAVNSTMGTVLNGQGGVAQGYGSVVIGRYNSIQGNQFAWVRGDQALIIGNGTGQSARSTAFYVTNNGTVWTNGSVLTPLLCLNGDCKTAWPSGSGGNVSSNNGSSGYIARFSNSTNVGTGALYDDGTGRIGINIASPQTALDVNGTVRSAINGSVLRRLGSLTLNSGEDGALGIASDGRYMYIPSYTSPSIITVVDASNPSSPRRIGSLTLPVGETNISSLVVSGKYLYAATYSNPIKVIVIDISNPAFPVRTGSTTLSSGEVTQLGIAAFGPYIYVPTLSTPARLVTVDATDPANPIRVGHVALGSGDDGGLSVTVAGRYAYLSLNTAPARFFVFDLINPASPQNIGNVTLNSGENSVFKTTILGDYAYLTAGTSPGTIIAVDISNPTAPTRVGALTLNTGENATYATAGSGNYLYVPTNTNPGNLVVVDVSTPASPRRVANLTLATGDNLTRSIVVIGKHAYLATFTTPSKLITIELPGLDAATANIDSLETGQLNVRQDARIANSLYLTGSAAIGQSLRVNGQANFVNTTVLGVLNATSLIGSTVNVSTSVAAPLLCVNGDCRSSWPTTASGNISANASSAAGYVAIFTNNTNIDKGILTADANTIGILRNASSDTALLSLSGGSLVQTAYSNPTITGTYDTAGNTLDVQVSGRFAYVSDSGSFRIFDVQHPYLTGPIGSVTPSGGGSVRASAIGGRYAYIARDSAGFSVVNIASPTAPTVSTTVAAGTITDIALSGNYLYLAAGTTGLIVYDVSTPTTPVYVTTLDPGSVDYITIQGQFIYAGDIAAPAARIIDIGTPTVPNQVGAIGTTGNAGGVAASGGYMFVAAGSQGLRVFNTTDPGNPIALARNANSTNADDIVVFGDYAYLSDTTDGLMIFNIKNPAYVSYIGKYDSTGSAQGVAVSGRQVYLADGTSGLHVITINGMETPAITAGSTETDVLKVRQSADIAGSANIRGGLNVGPLGIQTEGTLGVTSSATITGNLNASSIVYTPQLCLNGTCRTSWPAGNVTSSNGTAGLPAVWTNSTNIAALRIAASMIANSAINSSLLNTSNTGTSGQVLTLSAGLNQFTWTTASSSGNVTSSNGTAGYVGRFTNSTNFATGTLYDSGSAVGIGSTTPTQALDVRGNANVSGTVIGLRLDLSNGTINGTGGEVVIEQSGDSFGPTRLRLQNRNGANGAIFEQGNASLELIDFKMAVSSSSGNIRYEDRNAFSYISTDPEFQFGAAGNPTLIIDSSGNGGTYVRQGGVSIGGRGVDNSVKLFVNSSARFTATNEATGTTLLVNVTSSKVGINTSTPQYALDVTGSANVSGILYTPQICLNGVCQTSWPSSGGGNVTSTNGTAGYVGRFTNSTNIATGAIYDDGAVKVGINTTSPTQALDVRGNVNISGTIFYGANLTGYGADFAERMTQAETVFPGDVVCLTENKMIERCKEHADIDVAGIVSINPTIIGNANAPNSVAVGIVGMVATKVLGPVKRGQLLTTSSTPGYAEPATIENFGAIIGKAMEPCNDDVCIITVLVGLR